MSDRRGQLRWLSATITIDMVGTGTFLPVSLLFFTKVSGIDLATVGWCLGAASLVALPLPFVIGQVADRYGSRQPVLVGLVLQGLGFLGYLMVTNAAGLFVAALTVAVGLRIYWSSAFTLVADLTEPHERDRWFGIAAATRNIGVACGALLAAALLALDTDGAQRLIVVLNGLTFLLSAALLAWRVRNPRRSAEPAEEEAGTPYRDRPFLALTAIQTVYATCVALLSVGIPLFVNDSLHAPAWIAGAVFTVNTVLLATCQTIAVRLIRGFRRTRVMAVCGLLWAFWGLGTAGALYVPAVVVAPVLIIATLGYTSAELLSASTGNAIATATAPVRSRGQYLSAFQLGFAVANTVAPVLYTQLVTLGAAVPWLAVAIVAIVASVAMSMLQRSLPIAATRAPATDPVPS
ncbi:MFS transporter [Fodinicola acaciae]|uniref:MFS transporter n=1 Tax=Fodinicola acaciae TaxID=2681555 RepID=UPI0013D01077|nr:MFS transporter [Fodinicola acaciae]